MPKSKPQTPNESPYVQDESIIKIEESLSLRWIAVSDIPNLLWEKNPKLHNLGVIWESIVAFGYADPAKWDASLKNRSGGLGAIVFGNGRSEAVHWGWEAYQRGDWSGEIPRGIGQDEAGNWYIQCKFGLNADSEAAAADFAIAHNNITMLGGDFEDIDVWSMYDKEALAEVGKLVQGNRDFKPVAMTDDEVDALLSFLDKGKETPPGDSEAQLNRAHEWREKWNVEKGQLWQIGRHRLICGDSYDEDTRNRLLNGVIPDMLHTDAPYGISIVKPERGGSAADSGGSKPYGKPSKNQWAKNRPEYLTMKGDDVQKGKVGGGRGDLIRLHAQQTGRVAPANIVQSNVYPVIEGDDKPFDPAFLLDMSPIIVLWGANYFADKLPISSGWITWDKREGITRNNFADCELAWTNQDKPARIFYHLWNGLHKGSQHGERRVHPTEKPVALFAEIGKLLAPDGIWLDLFAGSGAQIVAAEQTGATCYAVEYEVLYVATILERLSQMGLEPVLTD